MIEHSDASLEEIAGQFGNKVLDSAALLTEPLLGSRSPWRNLCLKVIAAGPDLARLVKVADYLERIDVGGPDGDEARREADCFLRELRCQPLPPKANGAAELLEWTCRAGQGDRREHGAAAP